MYYDIEWLKHGLTFIGLSFVKYTTLINYPLTLNLGKYPSDVILNDLQSNRIESDLFVQHTV